MGVLVLSLAILWILRFPALHWGFYWDVAWVYGPAIFEMIEKGPSLLPGSINPFLHTGHPLFFYFLESLWGRLFGSQVFSLQLFALLISSALFTFVLYLVKQLFKHSLLTLFMAILLFQPVFLAQSTFVLPEMLLALLSLASIWYFSKQNYWLYFLFAGLLVLTKESGLAIVAGISAAAFFRAQSSSVLYRFKEGIQYFLAILPFVGFIFIQKIQLGWYFFPRHFNWISFDVREILNKSYDTAHFIMIDQQRLYVFIGLILLSHLLCYFFPGNNQRKKGAKVALIMLDTVLLYAFFAPSFKWQAATLPLFLLRSFVLFHYNRHMFSKKQSDFVLSLLFCSLSFFIFCILNFMSLRYLGTLLLLLLLMHVASIVQLVYAKKWPYLLSLFLLANQILAYRTSWQSDTFFDVELSYGRMIKVLSEMVEITNKQLDPDKDILLTHGQFKEALTRPKIGYQKKGTHLAPEKVLINSREAADYMVISTCEHHSILDSLAALPSSNLIHEVRDGAAYSQLYKLHQ